MSRRRAFRPDALGPLEERRVPSQVALVHQNLFETAALRGVQLRPTIATTRQGSDRVTLHRRAERGGLNFFAVAGVPDASELARGADPNVVTYMIRFRNDGPTPLTSASIVDTLDRHLTYVPGSATVPDGGSFSATGNRQGQQVLRWDLPGGLAPGASSFVRFQARYQAGPGRPA